MSRLDAAFERLRGRGERALVAYLTAGDPSLDVTARLVVEADRRGADVIELGVPFSDPLADGPVIQRAAQRALEAGASLRRVLELVRGLRGEVRAPIALLTYYNPVLAFGLRPFAETAAKVGVDGAIVADLPPEEAGPLAAELEPVGLDLIHLAAPTSTTERLRLIARRSRGFIYLVSLTGVTGERSALPPDLQQQLRSLRLLTTKPVCVGFGIGRPEQVAAVGRLADGVIVGSAIVRLIEQHAQSPDLVARVGAFIAALKAPLRAPASPAPSNGGRSRRGAEPPAEGGRGA
ncbi:MAG: tryptophan synthase subunit alpha [Candidatus Rokubacteria bacterium]|nr:tryptophan synthase subunit alpha [Candidatus Rokubacteria bacterium]